MTGTITYAVVTLYSAARSGHLRRQMTGLAEAAAVAQTSTGATLLHHIAVCLDDHMRGSSLADPAADAPPESLTTLHVPPGPHGMRLARARNEGAAAAIAAGARVLIFLDVDCIPGRDLFAKYLEAATTHSHAVVCGPVTYLPEGQLEFDTETLAAATHPHPAREFPPDGALRSAESHEYGLFWSLSFAMTAQAWASTGGFSEAYEGYGGEDTDFAFRLRESAIELLWVGGAHAFHQHHPTSSPPWQHLDAILRNGVVFADRWGEWPMRGWLDAFAEAGAIEYIRGAWRRTTDPGVSASRGNTGGAAAVPP